MYDTVCVILQINNFLIPAPSTLTLYCKVNLQLANRNGILTPAEVCASILFGDVHYGQAERGPLLRYNVLGARLYVLVRNRSLPHGIGGREGLLLSAGQCHIAPFYYGHQWISLGVRRLCETTQFWMR